MPQVQCLLYGKVFKGESGRDWHMARVHGDRDAQTAQPEIVAFSPAALGYVIQVADRTGLFMSESLDLLVASCLDNDLLDAVLDTWDSDESGPGHAPWRLPLSDRDLDGNLIKSC